MKIQAGIALGLLVLLVAFAARSEWRAMQQPDDEAPAEAQAEFSVTPTGQGQYVMRASDKIFYCVGNRCTGIQLVTGTQQPAPATEAAPPD